MNIVMIADQYPPLVGGYERQAHKLSMALAQRGHRVRVLTGRWQRSMPARVTMDQVEVERLGTLFRMFDLPGLRKYSEDLFDHNVLARLRELAPDADVFHAHALRRAARPALQVSLESGVPLLVKERSAGSGNSFNTLPLVHRGRALREYFRRELRHVAVLNAQAQADYEAFGFERLTIHRVVNGVDVDASTPNWAPVDPPRLLFLGRIHPVKGALELLRAFVRIAPDWPDVRLRFCGEGPGLPALRDLAQAHGLAQRVETPGNVSDPLRQLARALAVVVPSHTEGMSNTVLEALAVGTPTVATAVPGNAEVLGDLAWLVPSTAPADLAAGMDALLSSRGVLAVRSQEMRARARDRYAMDEVAESYERLYGELIETKASSRA